MIFIVKKTLTAEMEESVFLVNANVKLDSWVHIVPSITALLKPCLVRTLVFAGIPNVIVTMEQFLVHMDANRFIVLGW